LTLLSVMLAVTCAVTALWFASEDAPRVSGEKPVSVADVQRARMLMAQNDPRRAKSGVLRTMRLTGADLNLLLQYAAEHAHVAGMSVDLSDGEAVLTASVAARSNPLGQWLNVEASFHDTAGMPTIDRLRVGRLPLPHFLSDGAVEWALHRYGADGALKSAKEMVKSVAITPSGVRVGYMLNHDAIGQVRDMLMADEDVARLRVYTLRLSQIVAAVPPQAKLSLTELLQPMFRLATERWADNDGEQENRAVLLALALYVTGHSPGRYLGASAEWPTPARRVVTLAGRDDFPKHFLVSAVLSAEAGGVLADAVGLSKEVDDSHGGSGFSFNDIAADRSGTQFGLLAIADPARLRSAMARSVAEQDIFPQVSDLPEFMPDSVFQRRFGGIGAPEYRKMMSMIEARVAAIPLYRP
jgi:hypothetical protein